MTNWKRVSILVAGTTPEGASQLDQLLSKTGCYQHLNQNPLFKANSNEQTLVLLSQHPIDVIILALDLRQSNASSKLSQIHTLYPDTQIVVFADEPFEIQAEGAVNQGAFDYITSDEINPKLIQRILRHITKGRNKTSAAIQASTTDDLTGLSNRAGFVDFVQRQLREAERLHFQLSLLCIDCDNFKLINDTQGLSVGDDFLTEFAQHLKRCVRSSDFVARLGADEFVVVINSKDDRAIGSAKVADNILRSVRQGIVLDQSHRVDTRCSIGVTRYSGQHPAPNADQFLQEATSAMNSSKHSGGDCVTFFDRSLGNQAERRIHLLKEIPRAFKTGQFCLHYQPIFTTDNNKIGGYEALLRWPTSDGKMISPSEFVPILEENGMIHMMGLWVIQQACNDFLKLIQLNAIDFNCWISVNISPLQIQSPSFVDRVATIIQKNGLQPGNLHLEITESSLIDKTDFTLQSLAALRALGCHLSLDDFGVGYSSMTYLKDLPVDTLKIDQSFVKHFDNDNSNHAILRAMISLAHDLNKKVVAEGVESEEAASYLKQRGCEYLQGFLYAKPMPFEQALEFTYLVNQVATHQQKKSV